MTTVPVVWLSRDETILHRGYADQAVTEAILDRTLWRPANPITYEHREVQGSLPNDLRGGVIVVPSRHHVDHVDWLITQLARLDWAVLILTSEEEWVTEWARIPMPDTRKLWVMQGRPEHDGHRFLPCGWYPKTCEMLAAAGRKARTLDWFFAGQVTHERRHACVEALGHSPGDGYLYKTDSYFSGMPQAEYFELMAAAKLVPCPSGPVSLCTARVEEALEAGCVPILDMVTPTDTQFDYFEMVFPGHPFPTIYNWEDLPGIIDRELEAWPANANACWSYWQQWKRETAWKLDDDVRAVSGLSTSSDDPNDLVTAIVTTSPTVMHPDTTHIETVIASIRAHLPLAEIVIVADGVRPEQERLRAQYEDYLHRLLWLASFEWSNVVVLRREEWGHQAHSMADALALVRTPLVLFAEHDTPLKETPIDWHGITAVVTSGEFNLIRFHHEAEILPDHHHLMLDRKAKRVGGHGHYREPDEFHPAPEWVWDTTPAPVIRTLAWWQRPHVASTRFYREQVMPFFTPECRTMIEDPLYGHLLDLRAQHGDAVWWDWRLAIYAPDGGMQRSYHLDSRGDEPKFDMRFPSRG